MLGRLRSCIHVAAVALAVAACGASGEAPLEGPTTEQDPPLVRLGRLARPQVLRPRADPTNAFADDPVAATLGQKLFFDARFSGPLLDSDNDGGPNALGMVGEPGRVACSGCHLPSAGFLDGRSSRGQISLGAGWTRRRSPSLLDFGQRSILMWDGRRDTAFGQIFGVIESPLEFNSSPLFVAQQVARYYRAEYEAIFGGMPSLAVYEEIAPEQAGCNEMPSNQVTGRCPKPGADDPAVIQVVVNAGKAIGAYERLLDCGYSRFDAWIHGDSEALSAEEQAGAFLFVEKGCDSCHSGPSLTDDKFHNVGAANVVPNFVEPYDDPGAVDGLTGALADPLNSSGIYSDGDDGRLTKFSPNLETMRGAFRTPSLRCVSRRPSFMHAGQIRSLADVVLFFDEGGDVRGYQGEKDARIVPLGLSSEQRKQLLAFLRALDGPGPDAALLVDPFASEN